MMECLGWISNKSVFLKCHTLTYKALMHSHSFRTGLDVVREFAPRPVAHIVP
jgi:hypothetical protein